MLKDIFVSEVRIKLLKVMLPMPERALHVRALVREVKTEINAVRRELTRLTAIGLLIPRKSSNRIYYTVNTECIYYPELLSLISKEHGLGGSIISSAKHLGGVKFAVLSREFSRGRVPTSLDIDLFIVGTDINLPTLEKLVKDEQTRIGREINYTVMGDEEFIFRKRKNDSFIAKILSQSRTVLIGNEDDFCKIF